LFSQVARDKVVVELFTGVNCPYCPAAANGIKDMLAASVENRTDKTKLIEKL
jgi:hypothetical protein